MRKSSSLGLSQVLALLLLAGCSFSQSKGHYCASDDECTPGSCHNGFCINEPSAATSGGKGGRGGATTGTSETTVEEGGSGASTGTTTSPTTGQSGAGGSTSNGSGGNASTRDAGVDAGGGTPPATGDCKASDAPRSGTIAAGCMGTQRCSGTTWGPCEPPADRLSKPETCNGLDDNCNSVVDDLPPVRCYPNGTAGCTAKADGTFDCKGLCGTGTQECMNGQLGECIGAKTPQMEVCQGAGEVAVDEDCNGTPDDKCQCTTSQSCYTGGGTQGIGECRPGTRQCVNGMYVMECVGEVRDSAEVCNGKDDNCNGKTDDVDGVGLPCTIAGAKGVCASGTSQCVTGLGGLQCVATMMAGAETCNGRDDNCDGITDNVPGLETDSSMCGACGAPACGAGSTCCASACVNLQTDTKNCGMCGKACPAGDSCVMGACKLPTTGGAGGATGGAGGASGGSGGAGGTMTGGAGGATGGAGGAMP